MFYVARVWVWFGVKFSLKNFRARLQGVDITDKDLRITDSLTFVRV